MKRLLTATFDNKFAVERMIQYFEAAMKKTPLHVVLANLENLIKCETIEDPFRTDNDIHDEVYIIDFINYHDEHLDVAWSSYYEDEYRFITMHFRTFGYELDSANGEASITIKCAEPEIKWVVEGSTKSTIWEDLTKC